MKILFLGNKGDFHVDAWTKYFTKNNKVFLFSEDSSFLPDRYFKGVKIYLNGGLFGLLIKYFKIKSRIFLHLNKLLSVKVFANNIKKIVFLENIDIIHAHSLYYGFLVSFLRTDVPVVFTPMGSDIIIHSFNNRFYNFMAKKAYSACQIVTGDSKLIQRKGYELGASISNNYIIQNGVENRIFYPKKNLIKEKLGLTDNDILLFSPRAIDPLYNIDIIIDSIANLVDEKFKIKCMFAYAFGDNYLELLKSKVNRYGIEESVIWLGYLSYEEMATKYNAADIIISIPSSDSSPRSVYEGMFCKKPVIISDLEWNHEFLDQNCVYSINNPSEEKLATAIKTLFNDKKLKEKISKNAVQVAKKYFDYESNMIKMEKIMNDYLEYEQS